MCNDYFVYVAYSVHLTLYLKSSVKLTGGDGKTPETAYTLG